MSEPIEIWNLGTRGSNQLQHQRIAGLEGTHSLVGLQALPGQKPEDFLYTQDAVRIGGYLFRRISLTPVVLNRPDTAESRGQIRFFFILSGRMTLTQAGRTVTLGPGDSAVTIGWQPYLAEILEPTMLIGAALGRDVLDSRGIVYPHADRKLAAPSLLANGMTGFFMGLFEARLYPLSLEQTTRLTRVFDTFMVELHLGYVEESKDPDDRLAEQRDAILEFARARAEREAVSVASVAEHYNMSTRSLQRLFQNAPRSLRDELRLIQEATNE